MMQIKRGDRRKIFCKKSIQLILNTACRSKNKRAVENNKSKRAKELPRVDEIGLIADLKNAVMKYALDFLIKWKHFCPILFIFHDPIPQKY